MTDGGPSHFRAEQPERAAWPSSAGVEPEPAGSAPTVRTRAVSLRRVLVATDLVAAAVAWALALAAWTGVAGSRPDGAASIALLAAMPVVVVGLAGWQRLYLARVAADRTQEVQRLLRVAVIGALAAPLVVQVAGDALDVRRTVLGGVSTFLLMVVGRGFYGGWLRSMRLDGRYHRPIVVVGADLEALAMVQFLAEHPELGFRVHGVVGGPTDADAWPQTLPILGGVHETHRVVEEVGASGAILVVGALRPDELNRLSRELVDRGVHVHLSTGLRGIDRRRLRVTTFAREPVFYLERRPAELARWQAALKRMLDVLLAGVLLVASLPALVLAAIAIKLSDRGPVLFRQTRVGRHGEPFTLLKLRTMAPDAEARLQEVLDANEREGGPLFKVRRDPRRTRVGRLLERSSVDELPQLWNVLRGEMSLVGPRPALEDEVAEFDQAHHARHSVRPGMTGLWQVEARDNPYFSEYRRLDLFYVENWSVSLDIAILVGTAQSLLSRWFHR